MSTFTNSHCEILLHGTPFEQYKFELNEVMARYPTDLDDFEFRMGQSATIWAQMADSSLLVFILISYSKIIDQHSTFPSTTNIRVRTNSWFSTNSPCNYATRSHNNTSSICFVLSFASPASARVKAKEKERAYATRQALGRARVATATLPTLAKGADKH